MSERTDLRWLPMALKMGTVREGEPVQPIKLGPRGAWGHQVSDAESGCDRMLKDRILARGPVKPTDGEEDDDE